MATGARVKSLTVRERSRTGSPTGFALAQDLLETTDLDRQTKTIHAEHHHG
jgi:hypothetical protein